MPAPSQAPQPTREPAREPLAYTRTIRFKLTVWFVGVLALVILILSALLYFGLERILLQSADTTLRAAADRSIAPAEPATGSTLSSDPAKEQERERLRQLMLLSNTPARLLGLDGVPLQVDPLFPGGIPVTQAALDTANAGSARIETIYANGHAYRLYSAPVRMNEARIAVVQVIDPLDEQFRTLADLRAMLIWFVPISLILASLGGSFLAGRALAPMQRVRRDVEKIIEHADLSHRVSTDLPEDEVGRLARTFDDLLDRIQHTMDRERQFTADASHELRTPLTALKGEISVALSRPRTAQEYREVLETLELSVDDISRLVEDLLTLARASSGSPALSEVPINLVELVTQVCERLSIIADSKRISLCAPGAPDPDGPKAIVVGDRIKLQRVFTNLLDNALHYTPEGGRVEVTVRREAAWSYVDVRDSGRGIAPAHLPDLFNRFYRADTSGRARESGGTGLGLAIAQATIVAHGGRITVTSLLGQGSCFTVKLPALGTEQPTRKTGPRRLTEWKAWGQR
jgi:heavy metal sensor kinase